MHYFYLAKTFHISWCLQSRNDVVLEWTWLGESIDAQ